MPLRTRKEYATVMSHDDEDATERAVSEREACLGLILELRSQGIRDRRLLSAIERVPRRLFLSARQRTLAYVDTQLPIECGQSTSAPSILARMVEALVVEPGNRVLHVGTGSGYQAAILAHLAGTVVSAERYRTLVDLARQRLATLKLGNVELRHADGLVVPEGEEPYDRILVSGAVEEVPAELRSALAPNGFLVVPVGPSGGEQQLQRVPARGAPVDLGKVRLVPLTRGLATRL